MKAFSQLRLRFALLCCLLTGAVLLAACVLAWQNAARQVRENYRTQFDTRFTAMADQLRATHTVNELDIYRFEEENNVWMNLYDNGATVRFWNHTGGAAREAVMAIAQDTVPWATPADKTEHAIVVPQSTGNSHGEYQGRYAVIQAGNSRYGLLMMRPMAKQEAELSALARWWVLVFFGGFLALAAVSLLLARLAVAPARRAHTKQMEFVAAAGHELKSPLAVVLTSAGMIEKDPACTPEYVRNITGEATRMNRLVEDLLMLTAGDAARMAVAKARVDTEAMLISVYDRFLPLARQKGYALELELPSGPLPAVMADEERVVQLLSNLLSNAFCYATPGRVALSARASRRWLFLSVADTGPGLSKEQQRVLDRFYRGDASHSGKDHFGLGLSVAAQIAALHGGRLSVHSADIGGTEFLVALPL